jgi:hypothetical protein
MAAKSAIHAFVSAKESGPFFYTKPGGTTQTSLRSMIAAPAKQKTSAPEPAPLKTPMPPGQKVFCGAFLQKSDHLLSLFLYHSLTIRLTKPAHRPKKS